MLPVVNFEKESRKLRLRRVYEWGDNSIEGVSGVQNWSEQQLVPPTRIIASSHHVRAMVAATWLLTANTTKATLCKFFQFALSTKSVI